jgi:hypothetical protein
MAPEEPYVNERLDHLGIVAGVCQEIGLAGWLDAQEPGNRKPGECGNSNSGHDSQWIRIQQSAVVFGAAILCQQAHRTFVGSGDHRRDARVLTAWGARWTGSTLTI